MKENRVKRLLKEGRKTLGCWIHTGNAMAAELLGQLGFDWVMIDTEHGPLQLETITSVMQAMRGMDTLPFVRVAWNDLVLIKRAFDCGAYGVMIPMVCSKEEAERAVQYVKIPPLGIRGIARTRSLNYGLDMKDYLAKANDEMMTIVQIEHVKAVENLKEILSVEGLDVIFIGPGDLSISMGYAGQMDHPEVQETINYIVENALKAGIPVGTISGSPEDTNKRFDQGFQFICLNGDLHFMRVAAMDALQRVKR